MKLQFGQLIIGENEVERLEELGYTPESLKIAVSEHKSNCHGEPSIYCGTYGKYNDGNLCGLWIDVSSFDDYDEFINFCKAIHADEDDPELMFQDYECFLRAILKGCGGRFHRLGQRGLGAFRGLLLRRIRQRGGLCERTH